MNSIVTYALQCQSRAMLRSGGASWQNRIVPVYVIDRDDAHGKLLSNMIV